MRGSGVATLASAISVPIYIYIYITPYVLTAPRFHILPGGTLGPPRSAPVALGPKNDKCWFKFVL